MLSLSGCNLHNGEPDLNPQFNVAIDEPEITPDEPFSITLSVTNPSNEAITFRTSCQEFAGLFTYHDDELVDFSGNHSTCSRMINTYELEPGRELTFSWNLEASIVKWNSVTLTTDTTSATPGEYVMQIRITADSLNSQEFKIDHLEKMLVIQ